MIQNWGREIYLDLNVDLNLDFKLDLKLGIKKEPEKLLMTITTDLKRLIR